jgi:hypothetical protein
MWRLAACWRAELRHTLWQVRWWRISVWVGRRPRERTAALVRYEAGRWLTSGRTMRFRILAPTSAAVWSFLRSVSIL